MKSDLERSGRPRSSSLGESRHNKLSDDVQKTACRSNVVLHQVRVVDGAPITYTGLSGFYGKICQNDNAELVQIDI